MPTVIVSSRPSWQPAEPHHTPAYQEAFWQLHKEKKGMPVMVHEIEARARDLIVLPPLPKCSVCGAQNGHAAGCSLKMLIDLGMA